MSSRCRTGGFTLIELMVTIAVLAVLLTLGLPSFQSSLRSNRVATATNELIASLSLARSEAIRSTHGGGICASNNGSSCSGTWSDGWMVWADADGNGSFGSNDTVLRYSRGSGKLNVSGPNAITFDGRGMRRSSLGQAITLRPTECGGQQLQRKLTVNSVGQVHTDREDCS